MERGSATVSAAASSTSLEDGLCRSVPGLAAVIGLRRLTGGSSHETWSFDGVFEGESDPVPLILRREFDHSLFEMTSQAEFELMVRLHNAGALVPRPIYGGSNQTPLGTPFMVIERVPGIDARKAMARGGLDHAAQAQALVAALAGVHSLDVSICNGILPIARRSTDQLPQWAGTVRRADAGGMIAIGLAWLERNGFDIDDPVIVHGDFKANNVLVDDGGRVTIIDWELAHGGDPVEDLAWTALWSSPADLVGGMLTETDFLRRYTELSGRSVAPDRFRYWQIFSLVKLSAIFLKGLEADDKVEPRPMLLMLAQSLPSIEDALARILAEQPVGR